MAKENKEISKLLQMIETLKKSLPIEIDKAISEYMRSQAFAQRKIADTPTDAFSVVSRQYVNLYGSVAGRPSSSVATMGQRFFATDTNIPMTYNGTNWLNGIGSVVALGN